MRTLCVILCLLASPALALEVDLPPPQYDHPFDGKLIVETMRWWDVATRCHMRGVSACAWRFRESDGSTACHIIYPKLDTGGINASDLVGLIRHETAHCNGWPNDHPNSHYE